MKKAKILVIAVLIISLTVGGMTVSAHGNPLPFEDISMDDWFYYGVEYAYTAELMNGVSETQFDPYGTATRAMIVTVLYRLAGEPYFDDILMYANFGDVMQGSWYEPAIGWAARDGIVEGVGEGMVDPDGPITREQLITMIYRYMGEPAVVVPEGTEYYASEWAASAMAWAYETGVMNGLVDGFTSDMQGAAMRSEIACVFTAYLELGVGGFA